MLYVKTVAVLILPVPRNV